MSELFLAIDTGDAEKVRALLENEGRKHIYDTDEEFKNTPLHAAAAADNLDIMKLLVGAGANVNALNAFQWNPLHYVPHLDSSRFLIENGALVNAKGIDGGTPLMRASSHDVKKDSLVDVVRFFLEKGFLHITQFLV